MGDNSDWYIFMYMDGALSSALEISAHCSENFLKKNITVCVRVWWRAQGSVLITYII